MASTTDLFEDFDLDFLQSNILTGTTDKLSKQKKSVLTAKKKIIATDTIIKKYYEKKETLDTTERCLLEARLECKQACIDFKSAMERLKCLEENEQIYSVKNQELQESVALSESRYIAIQSHVNQLQSLIKENETKIESMAIENDLQISNVKELKKKIKMIEKEKETMNQHICVFKDILLGKKKLDNESKIILKKYSTDDEFLNIKVSDVESGNENDYEDAWMDEPSSHKLEEMVESEEISLQQLKDEIILARNIDSNSDMELISIEQETDFFPEAATSVDTGRGSSRTPSDEGKCFQSPDYYPDHSSEPHKGLTSPKIVTTCDAATSPIKFDLTRPLCDETNLTSEWTEECTNTTTEIQIDQSCLDISKAKNVEDVNDSEVSNIFSSMSLHLNLVTPLPPSPCLSMRSGRNDSFTHHTCQEAEKIREENRSLHSSIASLAKEIMEIKSILRVQNETAVASEQINESEKASPKHKNSKHDKNSKSKKDNEHETHSLENSVSVIEEETIIPNLNNDKEEDEEENDLIILKPLTSENTCYTSDEDNVLENSNKSIVEKIVFSESGIDDHSMSQENIQCDDSKTKDKTERAIRKQRLSKLQKMRVKLLPKNKIKSSIFSSMKDPTKKLSKPSNNIKKVTKNTPSKLLNDKSVYEKALKVVTELKAKKILEQNKIIKKRVIKRNTRCNKINMSIDNDSVLDKNEAENNYINKECSFNSKTVGGEIENHSTLNEDLSKLSKDSDKTIEVLPSVKDTRNTEESPNLTQTSNTSETMLNKMESECENNVPNSSRLNITNTNCHKIKNNKMPVQNRISPRRLRSLSNNTNFENENNHSKDTISNNCSHNKDSSEIITDERRSDLNKDNNVSLKRSLSPELNNEPFRRKLRSSNAKSPVIKNIDEQPDKELNIAQNCHHREIKNLEDDLFSTEPIAKKAKFESLKWSPKDSLFCQMIEKYSLKTIRNSPKTAIDKSEDVFKSIDKHMDKINGLKGTEVNEAMDELVDEMKILDHKVFLAALMHYLSDPMRKMDLLSKTCLPPAPPMSKQEQILLYVINKLQSHWSQIDLVKEILRNMEFKLFKLTQQPELNTVESLSHFFAVLCRYTRSKNRLRLFILDAMYCMSYKAVPLIRQCIDVWTHVIPLAHMNSAQSPLVQCLVYLLHFYKCEDKRNSVNDIRFLLHKRYSYKMAEWNEKKILELLNTSVTQIRDIPIEKKMLRTSLILIAKRQSPRWCEKHIFKGILLPLIEKRDTPDRVKNFCISLFGPLLRPFPADMRLQCEVYMNQLFRMMDERVSANSEEAIVTSLISMYRHNQPRLHKLLLSWKPLRKPSSELEDVLKRYVQSKPIKSWEYTLSKINM